MLPTVRVVALKLPAVKGSPPASPLPPVVQLICENGMVSPAASMREAGSVAVTVAVFVPAPGVR